MAHSMKEQQTNKQINYTFQAASFIMVQFTLGILFFLLFIYATLRFYQMISSKETLLTKKKKSIFSSIYSFFVAIIALVICFFAFYYAIESVLNYKYLTNQVLVTNQESITSAIKNSLTVIFNDFIYIPDVIMFLTFLIVFNQWIIYDRYAHLNKGKIEVNTRFFVEKTYEIPQQVKIFFLIYILVQVIIILLFNCGIIFQDLMNIIDLIINSTQPILFTIYAIYKTRLYQGCPVKTIKDERNINRIEIVILYFTIGRCCQILINLYLLFNKDISYSYQTQTTWNAQTYIILLIFILIEIIFWLAPLFYSTSTKFLKILSLQFAEELKMIDLDQQYQNNTQNQKTDAIEIPEQKRFSITDYKDKTIIEFKVEEISLGQQIKVNSNRIQLGTLFHCKVDCSKYSGKEFVCRQIEVKRISQYLIEEINQSVQEYRKLSHRYIQPIKGMAIDKENIFFISPYFKMGNIAEYIYGTKKLDQVTDEMKSKYLLQVAIGMNYLHSSNLFHCNLSASNVMIHANGEIKVLQNHYILQITDFGLSALKKYQSLTSGSPEQLKERSATPTGTSQSDVYAFGMLAWEIFHSQQAFGNLSLPELVKLIADEAKRPKINENLPENIKLIIRACWQGDSTLRPTFQQVIDSLQDDQATALMLSSIKKK